MQRLDRRTFLQMLGTGAIAAAALPGSLRRALATPAHRRTGTISDVEHIVILTQENRSFDHYFGTLRGVRGFGDPHVARLASGKPVWYQPSGNSYVLPFRPAYNDVGMTFLPDPPHGWNDSHAAWNAGQYDQWVPSKGQSTMAHLTRKDIPYHFALAESFTVCDAYYCSLLGPTDPNRYHMWTGWVGNDGKGGGPVITNAEVGYDWSTYPERLQRAGISWKVYQDVGDGLDANGYWGWTGDPYIGNYGDNSLLYFHQFQNAPANSPLAQNGRTGTNIKVGGGLFDVLRDDVKNGKLPQVSWIAAPETYCEHPNWPANYGAWYIDQILDALTSNPEVWSRTAFFINYDENGGYFDHLIPPYPPASKAQGQSTVSTVNEIFPGDKSHPAGQYGLGVRVPMIIVSPWTRGGYVNSQVFDHTSLIRFLEARFGHEHNGLIESNITPWRRAVAGDLTSAFNFDHPNDDLPRLPKTVGYVPPDRLRHPDAVVVAPGVQALPAQEPGVRRARALPYELSVHGQLHLGDDTFRLTFDNTGKATAVFHVRSGNPAEGPRSYTVEPGKQLSDKWAAVAKDGRGYDLSVFGPNGFTRSFLGGQVLEQATDLDVGASYDRERGQLTLVIENRGHAHREVVVVDHYSGEQSAHRLGPGHSRRHALPSDDRHGWYDASVRVTEDHGFEYRFAGHIENGRESITDPAMAGGRIDDCEIDG